MNKQELRNSILSQEELIASRRRFGLFSQPPPLAVGDDGPFKHKIAKKGQDGKPITKARNLLAGPLKSGVLKNSYFNVPDSIYSKDPYQNEYKRNQKYYNAMHSKSAIHQLQFKPSTGFKTLAHPSYLYKQQNCPKKPFPSKDESGKVKTKQRNIVTNPITKVQTDLLKPPKHIIDPYERKQILQSQQRQLNRKKMPEAIFKSMSYGDKPFGKDKIIYGQDDKAKSILKPKTTPKNSMKTVMHETDFKPARRGHGDPLGRYPQWAGRKSQQIRPIKKEKKDGDRQSWKPNGNPLTRPTPSITLNPKNIGFLRKH